MLNAVVRLAIGLATLGAVTFGTPAHAESEPLLNPAVVVKGDIVRLGDLFNNLSPSKANLPAAYSPRPGERLVLDAERLVDITRAQGVNWVPQSRFDRAIVERAGRLIDRDQIATLVAGELEKSGVGKDDQVALDNDTLRFYVPAESTSPLQIRDLRYDAQNRRFSALLITDPSVNDSMVSLTGHVVHVIEVPVPTRAINRDEIVRRSDLNLVKLAADRLDANVVADADQLVGQTAAHLLRPGEPVRASDVHPPILVTKGSLVTMIYQTPYMVISLRGKAMQDGAKGETVRIMNLESKRELDGVVASTDTVVVQAIQQAASN
ncbi:MAG TPA: flagellar basal body P-ring formation chaperone FlgA [Alphaproteobacteria bacterium]|nr:flagellar basal body P-ring formation chaperone FlgA [Alphaproteobacteria bacterium]